MSLPTAIGRLSKLWCLVQDHAIHMTCVIHATLLQCEAHKPHIRRPQLQSSQERTQTWAAHRLDLHTDQRCAQAMSRCKDASRQYRIRQQRDLLQRECDRCSLFDVVLQLLDHVVRHNHDMPSGGCATQALDVLQAEDSLVNRLPCCCAQGVCERHSSGAPPALDVL